MLNTYTDVKAEQTILGSILINSRALKKIQFLKANDFYDQRDRWLYQTILDIVKKQHYVFIIPALKNKRKLSLFGGMSYFDHLIASIKNDRSIEDYAKRVHHLALLRLKHSRHQPKKRSVSKSQDLKQYQEPLLLANLIALGTSHGRQAKSVNPSFNSITKNLKSSYFRSLSGKALFKIFSKLNHEHTVINWPNVIHYLHKHEEYGLINYVSQIIINTNLSLNVYYLAYQIEKDAVRDKNQSHYQPGLRKKRRKATKKEPASSNESVHPNQQPPLQSHAPYNQALKAIKQEAKRERHANGERLKEYRKATQINPHVTLASPINQLYGVKHVDATGAKHLGINNVRDLLMYFPFRYKDLTITDINKIKNPLRIQATGKVVTEVTAKKTKSDQSKLPFLVDLISNHPRTYQRIEVNDSDKQHNLMKRLKKGDVVSLKGILDPEIFNASAYPSLTVETIKIVDKPNLKNESVAMYGIYKSSPQYHMPSTKVQHLMYLAYQQSSYLIKNNHLIPPTVRTQYHLEPENQVIHDLHFPLNKDAVRAAQRTAKFNEFLIFELKLQKQKAKHDRVKGTSIHYHPSLIDRFIHQLPYQLTHDQNDAIQDVLSDLHSHRQMKRLLQGDVGSGKTVVAMVGILATIDSGYQCALMCPTSILAKQHYQAFKIALRNFDVKISLLIGSLTPKQRSTQLSDIKHGRINLVIGTSALMQPKIQYHNLAMVVIDEQHRFGVHQRDALRDKGNGVNILSMTATPIPRTMALSSPIYSQLDTSRITHLPGGRKRTITRWIKDNDIKKCLPIIQRILHQKEQAFIVVPRIRTNESQYRTQITQLKRALSHTKRTDHNKIERLNSSLAVNQVKLDNQKELNSIHKLKRELGQLLPNVKIGVLDGEMNDRQKDRIMNNFADDQYQILISTTVVEVGIDIANACLMIIMNADRYGLATLHQLRGRVGRSDKQAYCILSAPVTTLTKDQRQRLDNDLQEVHRSDHKKSSLKVEIKHLRYLKHHGANGSKRMHVMCSTTDGFKIAEADMKLRGSGNLLGQRQSGMPKFKIGNPVDNSHDQDLMYRTERIADHIIDKSF